MADLLTNTDSMQLAEELRELISATRDRVARQVNSELVLLYWKVGVRLRSEVVEEPRAKYGKQVVAEVARTLSSEFGRGFNKRNLYHMMRFAEVFDDLQIVNALRTQLSWTHLRTLIAIEDPLKRQFYTELARIEGWSTRALKDKMDGMLYERSAIAKRPEELVESALTALGSDDRMTPDLVFQDPYILDFLGLPSDFSEAELEAAILSELETFLLELGQGFSFVARQKRMSIGADDFYLDLLFFHRPLRCLVAMAFEPAVLLLDEPATGLDLSGRRALLSSILDVVRDPQRSVIVSSHMLADVERVADRLVVLKQGGVVHQGPTDDLVGEDRTLEEALLAWGAA